MHMNLEDGLLACIKWYCYASSQLESPLAMGRMPATITLSHGQRGKRAGLSELLHGDIFLSGSAEQKLGCPPDMENG